MKPEDSPFLRAGESRWPEVAASRWDRKTYDACVSWLAARHLPLTVAALDSMGALANAVRVQAPTVSEVAALYTWLPRSRCRQLAPRIAALRFKNRLAVALVARRRVGQLARLVRWAGAGSADQLCDGGAKIVVACHVGAFFGISAALHSAGQAAFMLRDAPLYDAVRRAAALKQAVDAIRRGGLVVATLDGPGGSSTAEIACLGRQVVFRRGPFALARLTGAPLVPVACAWTGDGRIEVRIAPCVEAASATAAGPALDVERAMAASAGRWLDAYLRAEPQEIWPSTLRYFLATPLAT